MGDDDDNLNVRRERRFQRQYRLWIDSLAQSDCSCTGRGECAPCRARVALAELAKFEDVARLRRGGKPAKRKRGKRTK